ncbi:MAG: DNA-3-methyladenine glycosylase I [Candidatus Limnocylindria bacterium]
MGPGPDGRARCWWCLGSAEYVAYHDEVWGRPMHGESSLFEMLTLELFQSGLSWLTILRKRENFGAAFEGWDIERIASYGDADVERLMADAGIERNRAKIQATIANAGAVGALWAQGETLDELLWSFAPPPRGVPPASGSELESTTAESVAMSRKLKRRGFAFVGPTTAYSLMQAAGLVDDHLAGCEFGGTERPGGG